MTTARNLRLFYAYRLLSAGYLFVPAQVAFYLQHGLTWTEIFVLNSVFNAILIAFEVPTGALADRIGRRHAMVVGAFAMALAFLLYALSSTFPAFVVAESVFALGMTLTSGPDSAYLYDLLRGAGQETRYTQYEGVASSFKHIGMTLAFAIGGFLGQARTSLPYYVAAGVCALGAVVASCLGEAKAVHAMREQRWGGYVPHIFRALRLSLGGGRLRYAILYSSLVFVLLRVSLWLYQPYLAGAGLDLRMTGLVFAALYLMAALCSRYIDPIRRRLPNGSIYWALPAVLGGSYLVLGRFVALWGIVFLFAQKAVDGLYSPLTKEMLNREIADSSQRATVLSVESMTRRLAFGLFAPACGLLFDHYGRAAPFYLCAAIGVLGACALVMRGRADARAEAPGRLAQAEARVAPANVTAEGKGERSTSSQFM
jgi:MFS family permease